jgi:hypothetical protein
MTVTASAAIPLPVNTAATRTNWFAYGAAAMALVAGPGIVAALMALWLALQPA